MTFPRTARRRTRILIAALATLAISLASAVPAAAGDANQWTAK